MRILHIEDDGAVTAAVELMLRAEGMVVQTADLGEDGIDLAKHYDFDLILMDGDLPDMTGVEAVRQLRAAKVATPVLMVSGRAEMEFKVQAFAAGADDFLTKPFHRDELVARCRAIVRRKKGLPENKIEIEGLTVRIDEQQVLVNGRTIHLTGKEYQMLELLALRHGTTLTKQVIMDHLYGGMDEPELKIIDVFVCKLRRKLREAGADRLIHTTWGRGYVLQAAQPEAA